MELKRGLRDKKKKYRSVREKKLLGKIYEAYFGAQTSRSNSFFGDCADTVAEIGLILVSLKAKVIEREPDFYAEYY